MANGKLTLQDGVSGFGATLQSGTLSGDVVHTLPSTSSNLAPTASPEFTGTPTVNGVSFGGYSGFKNYIINGGFDIWQRGTSFSGANVYTADRWYISGIGQANPVSVTKQSPSAASHYIDGIDSYITLVTPSSWGATTQVNFEQRIENLKQFSSKELTVSFYIKGTGGLSDTDFYLVIVESYAGGSATTYKTYSSFASQINGAGWRKVSFTFTVSNMADKIFGGENHYLSVVFVIKPTTPVNNIIQIANVQLEEGSVATPFENRPIGLEFNLCQRYYQATQYGGLNAAAAGYLEYQTAAPNGNTATLGFTVELSNPMRAVPTVTFYAQVTGTAGSIRNAILGTDVAVGTGQINAQRFTPTNQSGATVADGTKLRFFYTADAEI